MRVRAAERRRGDPLRGADIVEAAIPSDGRWLNGAEGDPR